MTFAQKPSLLQRYLRGSLVLHIAIGILCGVVLAYVSPSTALSASLFGDFFVKSLKAIAPILVFLLVMASIANHKQAQQSHIRPVLVLYVAGTFIAALTAVMFSFVFPTHLSLVAPDLSQSAPQGIDEVLHTLVFKMVDNPVNALVQGNYVGILTWAIGFGLGLRHSSEATKALQIGRAHV